MGNFSDHIFIRFFRHKFVRRLLSAIVFFLFALLIGIIGYMTLEGYNLVEAVYMSIITLSTVGYGEIRPLSVNGQIFTSCFIIFNIGVLAYAVSVISAFIFEGDLKSIVMENKRKSEIKALSGHVIVCGYGRLGRIICSDLEKAGKRVLIIENEKEVIDELREKEKLFLEADATEDDTITDMHLERAETLIATFHADASNIFVVLSARERHPDLRIISRASSGANISKLRMAGADHVIVPEDLSASYIAAIASGKDHMPLGSE